MYREHAVGVVVPAYNEKRFVGDVIEGIPSFVDRIYVVDDRSTDGTWAEVLAAAEADAAVRGTAGQTASERTARIGASTDGETGTEVNSRTDGKDGPANRSVGNDRGRGPLFDRASVHEPVGRVVPVRHERNRGAGGAIETGYLAALQDDLGVDIVATVDADGQMDSRMLPRFLDPIVEGVADYTKGNRLLDPETRTEMPAFRLFGNFLLTFLTKIASGYWKTMDPQNGYTAIATDALAAIDVEGMYEYYGYCTDLLIKLNVERVRVADVAMPARYGEETSSIKYEEYITKVSLLLLRGFLWRLKTRYLLFDFHPVAFLYGLGALTTATGLLESLGALRRALPTDRPSVDPGAGSDFDSDSGSDPDPNSGSGPRSESLTHSALTFGVGCVLLILSMIFDMEANEDLETRVRE